VAIVGAPGARAEEPGHDLTYLADNGLVPGLELPATLYADMSGSLMAAEAVLQAALRKHERYAAAAIRTRGPVPGSRAVRCRRLPGLPQRWGLTQPQGSVGGAHAG
jgi:hypothetical protein